MKKYTIINNTVYENITENPEIGDIVMKPVKGWDMGYKEAEALTEEYGISVKYSGPWGGNGPFFTINGDDTCRVHYFDHAKRWTRALAVLKVGK